MMILLYQDALEKKMPHGNIPNIATNPDPKHPVNAQVFRRGGEEDVPCPRNVCASKTPNPGPVGLLVKCWDVLGGGDV